MKDKDFKNIDHSCEGYFKYSNGKSISGKYNPDYTLKCENQFIIIEHENEPNRKTIVADIFKASYFLKKEYKGILVIVLIPKGKSSFESYIKHSLQYFLWLKDKTNLQDVIFIRDSDYFSEKSVLTINGKKFNELSISLNSLTLE